MSEKPKSKTKLVDRLLARKGELGKKGTGKMLYFKEGSTRIRIANAGEENDWAVEVSYVYLNQELGGFISPATFGERCAFDEAYKKLSKSKKEKDRAFAEMLKPKKKWTVPCYKFKDQKGEEPDVERGLCIGLVTNGVYSEMIDYFTDDEYGDFTNPAKGYDLKIKRAGTGKMDTKYSVAPCKPTKVPVKEWRKEINPEEVVKSQLPTYEKTLEILEKFLNTVPEETEQKESNKSEKKDKKKKRNKDI